MWRFHSNIIYSYSTLKSHWFIGKLFIYLNRTKYFFIWNTKLFHTAYYKMFHKKNVFNYAGSGWWNSAKHRSGLVHIDGKDHGAQYWFEGEESTCSYRLSILTKISFLNYNYYVLAFNLITRNKSQYFLWIRIVHMNIFIFL